MILKYDFSEFVIIYSYICPFCYNAPVNPCWP